MQRVIALAVIALGIVACDPYHRLSVSRPITAPLDRTCLIEALRMEETVKEAAIVDSRLIWAEVILPAHLVKDGYPSTTGINVQQHRNAKEELEVNVFKSGVGSSPRPEFRDYMLKAMEDLRDRMIERCGAR
jgi:hypothetical protein